ncbi:TonB-dependent receptor [Brevundimonas goettingensis]|uniref:TonB-dependent receptor n=1 Tax=Brevundimonas goettingensis TaxID=2774190 RepID=A0A975C645_9CAUL|nr:TonB-dependent receptor [Brevundimonas goettingensis]QTC91956.1 TonB-dependent receptor [Brevundimonas goettingensis]
MTTRKFARLAGVSLGALTLALAVDARAQTQTPPQAPDDDATSVDEIVVTGFRASLANALNIKRREAGVVDAISAEDIADFPDTNLAESIQRIPGVSIDRDAGEGRTITVRGLGPDFTRTRINGIEAQATTGATDSSGGTNRGRGFDFNVFASELFNNITVRKTASAEVEEGSLGATVDLRTSHPFDYPGFTAAASVQGGYNDLSQTWSPRYAVLASSTWFDGQLGALASLAYSKKDSIEEGFSSVRWGPANGDNGFQNPTALPGGSAAAGGLYHPRIPRYGRLTHEQERTGFTFSAQFRPNNGKTLLTFDSLWSQLDSTRRENFLEAWSFSRNASQGGKPEVDIVDTVIDPDTGEMIYARFNDVDMRTENRFDILETSYTQNTLALEQSFTDTLKFTGTIGRSKSDFGNPLQVDAIIDHINGAGYSWDFRPNHDLPLINYGFDVTDPNAWSVTGPTGLLKSELRLNTSYQTNIYDTAEGAFEWNATDVLTFKAGASRKKYSSISTGYSRLNNVNDAPALPAGTTMASVTQLLTGFGRNLDLPAGSATSWIIPDLDALRNLWKWDCNCNTGVAGGDFRLLGLDNPGSFASFRQVTETDTGYWVQADWDTTLFGVPFRGNLGVRQVKTELEATGYSNINNLPVLTVGSNAYDDTLPSLNVAFEPIENLQIRFAAAKVMARPPITNLVPVYTLSAATAPNPSASIGNVDLEPYRAKTYDVSVEWYFAPESLLSFAYFYKDISTFVQTTQTTLPYSQLTAIDPVAFPAGARDPNLNHVFSTQANTPGGPLKGFEISYQQPFRFLPGLFSNLGTQLNYTHVESEIDYCTTAACSVYVTEDLVNLSPNAWNATLYYDDGTLNARISAAYRDDYYQQVPAANGGTRGIAVTGKTETLSIDGSASYALTDHVTVTLEAINLTDEPNRQYHGDLGGERNSTYVYHHTGRQVFIGARYKF